MLASLSTAASASEFYLAGQVGLAKVNDVNTDTFTDPTYGAISGSVRYDKDALFGLEIGLSDFEAADVLRLGLSWQSLDAGIDSARLNVTGSTDPQVPDGSYYASSSQLEALGVDFDSGLSLLAVNLCYDFPTNIKFKPYVAIGTGLADVNFAADGETAYLLSVGARYAINEQSNWGFKYQYVNAKSFTDDAGFDYNHFKVHAISATLDFSF